MLQETSMMYKLTILYILKRVDFPLSNSQISNFILENDYTDYFNIQQTMGELLDDGYVYKETIRNKTLYSISPSGANTLELLNSELSRDLKAEIDEYIMNNKIKLLDDISVLGDYYRTSADQFTAHLYINEGNKRMFEMNINASSEAEADKFCSTWATKGDKIYEELIKQLMN